MSIVLFINAEILLLKYFVQLVHFQFCNFALN